MRELEGELRVHARELIQQGRLPQAAPERIWAGQGSGRQQCNLCNQVIHPEEVEYEVDAGERVRLYHFHLRCHAAWQVECADWEPLKDPTDSS